MPTYSLARHCLAFVLACGCHPLTAAVYYDVDFSTPPNTLGAQPVIDASINTPSGHGHGSTEVVADLNGFFDQPVVFNTTGNTFPNFYYDQLYFALAEGQDTYHMGFDLVTEGLVGSENLLTVSFDMPNVSNLSLRNDGLIDPVSSAHLGGPGISTPYTDGTPMRIDISVDIPNSRKVVLIDGQTVYDGDIFLFPPSNPVDDLYAVRITFGRATAGPAPDNLTFIAFDNILIDNGFVTVPEPATAACLLAGLALLIRHRRGASSPPLPATRLH